MIKLELTSKPTQLTDELVTTKTAEFLNDRTKCVWSYPWLKEAVSNLSYGKCCYTEIPLNEESKFMEIDHFHPKSLYPEKVLQWGNLIPLCKKCNGMKKDHDTLQEPILNPFEDDPKEHFFFQMGILQIKNKSEKGKRTVKILDLNNSTHFSIPRYRIYERIKQQLSDLYEDLNDCKAESLPRKIQQFKNLLEQGHRSKQYAALTATTILTDDCFWKIWDFLISCNSIDTNLQELKKELEFCALIK